MVEANFGIRLELRFLLPRDCRVPESGMCIELHGVQAELMACRAVRSGRSKYLVTLGIPPGTEYYLPTARYRNTARTRSFARHDFTCSNEHTFRFRSREGYRHTFPVTNGENQRLMNMIVSTFKWHFGHELSLRNLARIE